MTVGTFEAYHTGGGWGGYHWGGAGNTERRTISRHISKIVKPPTTNIDTLPSLVCDPLVLDDASKNCILQ